MIRLPVNRVNELINSLEGNEVIVWSKTLMLSRKPHPFVLCVVKDKEKEGRALPPYRPNDLYYVYLIDLVGCCLVGERQIIHAELMYDDFNNPYLFKQGDAGHITYMSDIRWAWNPYEDLCLGRTGKELPVFNSGTYDLLYKDSTYYRERPLVKRSLRLHHFLYLYVDLVREGKSNAYEDWVLKYLSRLFLLEQIEVPCWVGFPTGDFKINKKYIKDLRKTESEILKDMNALWSSYPVCY